VRSLSRSAAILLVATAMTTGCAGSNEVPAGDAASATTVSQGSAETQSRPESSGSGPKSDHSDSAPKGGAKAPQSGSTPAATPAKSKKVAEGKPAVAKPNPVPEPAKPAAPQRKTVRGNGTIYCPSGWRLDSGGISSMPPESSNASGSVTYKVLQSGPSSNGWMAKAQRIDGYAPRLGSSDSAWRYETRPYYPSVYANCSL
jgi:hypothetical protein